MKLYQRNIQCFDEQKYFFMSATIKTGLTVGVLSSLFLGVLAISGNHGGSPVKYVKYIILIIGLITFYHKRIKDWTYKEFVAQYIGSAATISLITGLVIAVFNTNLYFINPEFSIQKYSLLADSITQLFIIDAIIIIETIVLGMLSGFIIFPYFKNKFLVKKDIHQP